MSEPCTKMCELCLTRGYNACVNAAQITAINVTVPQQEVWSLPVESSDEAMAAIKAVLKEYNYPANPTNAARAGYRAARLHRASKAEELYLWLRSQHWTDETLVVIRAKDVPLGVQTFSTNLLDEVIRKEMEA